MGTARGGAHGENLQQQYLNLPAGSPGYEVAQEYAGNLDGFIAAVTTRYFSVTTAAVRMYDTNHLILGVKAEGQEIQPQVIESAVPYVNVFSVEDYTLTAGFAQAVDQIWPYYLPVEPNLANMESYFNGPMMIGEYAFIAPGPQDPNTDPGIYYISAYEQARANPLLQLPGPVVRGRALVGRRRMVPVHRPAGQRPHSQRREQRLRPDQHRGSTVSGSDGGGLAHALDPGRPAHQSGPTCDSWAEGNRVAWSQRHHAGFAHLSGYHHR